MSPNKETSMIHRYHLKPIDVITCLYLAGSGVLAAAWWERLDGNRWLLPLYFAGAGLAVTAPPLLRRLNRPLTVFLSAWYPVFSLTLCYKSTALLNRASPISAIDQWLYNIDARLFGRPVCETFSGAVPGTFFAEVMSFSYFSYYFMIPGLALYFWIRNRRLFHDFVFCTAFCFYFFYLVFSLLPSAGPQFFIYGGALHWDGWFFGPMLTALLQGLEVPTGAFPSSHVGVALIVVVYAWRQNRIAGWIATLLSLMLSMAILYGGPHYFVDLPCGILVGAAFLGLAGPVTRMLEALLGEKTRPEAAIPRPFIEEK